MIFYDHQKHKTKSKQSSKVRSHQPAIPANVDPADLATIEEASEILNKQFRGNFSVPQIRRYLKEWQQGIHYLGGRPITLYLPNVREWWINR